MIRWVRSPSTRYEGSNRAPSYFAFPYKKFALLLPSDFSSHEEQQAAIEGYLTWRNGHRRRGWALTELGRNEEGMAHLREVPFGTGTFLRISSIHCPGEAAHRVTISTMKPNPLTTWKYLAPNPKSASKQLFLWGQLAPQMRVNPGF